MMFLRHWPRHALETPHSDHIDNDYIGTFRVNGDQLLLDVVHNVKPKRAHYEFVMPRDSYETGLEQVRREIGQLVDDLLGLATTECPAKCAALREIQGRILADA